MSRQTPESSAETSLRRSFPSLYITLVSIVIALAVEGLLGRLGSLESLGEPLEIALLVSQVGHFIWMASMFWWISARWVTTIPWPFGMFDGLSMILMLMGFQLISRSIASSVSDWHLYTGVFSLAGAFVYRFNGRRGILFTGRSQKNADLHRLPAAVAVSAGVGQCFAWAFTDPNTWPIALQLASVLLITGLVVVFAYADYWIWRKASEEPGRFDA